MSDVFQTKTEEEEIDRTPWGELEPSDEESSEEEEEEESDEDKPDETGFITPADRWGKQRVCLSEVVCLSLGALSLLQSLFLSSQWPHHSWRVLVSASWNGDP